MKLSRTKQDSAGKLAAFAFTALAFSVSAGAEEQETPYTMAAIVDASYGERVTAGDYEQAIQRISAPSYRLKDSFEAQTNLCVALLKSGAIGEATASCEAAVAESQRMSRFEPSRSELAIALSNRGVLRAVLGEEEMARQDFASAVELKSGIDAPTNNLARLDQELTQTGGSN